MTLPALSPLQGTLDLLVLRTLAAGGEMHGFEILDWIHESTGDELLVEDGALYHALHRMHRRGLLESSWGVSEKGRRARYYQLTALGRKERARAEAQWERYVQAVARIAPRRAG